MIGNTVADHRNGRALAVSVERRGARRLDRPLLRGEGVISACRGRRGRCQRGEHHHREHRRTAPPEPHTANDAATAKLFDDQPFRSAKVRSPSQWCSQPSIDARTAWMPMLRPWS